jgi:hypothetical protein
MGGEHHVAVVAGQGGAGQMTDREAQGAGGNAFGDDGPQAQARDLDAAHQVLWRERRA